MKKFLKRANRGLLLGGVILMALIIYIVIDYSRFNSEKSAIKKQIEDYMDSFFNHLESYDYEALLKLVNDSYTGKAVVSDSYFTDITDMSSKIKSISDSLSTEDKKISHMISNVSYRITSNSVKKAGPNMALVKLKYVVTLNSSSSSELVLPFPFGIYDGITYYDSPPVENEQFTYTFEADYTLYMYYEKGTWKFSQNSGYDQINNITSVKEVSE